MSIVETAVEDVAKTAIGDVAGTATEGAASSTLLPWILLAVAVAMIALAFGAYRFGVHVEKQSFDAYVSKEAAAAQAQVASNQKALKDLAASDAAAMDALTQSHNEATNENTQRRDALLTANRNLTQRLWVATAGRPSSGPAAVPSTGASGPVDNATGYATLSIGSSSFFIDEFSEADQLAIDLAAAQQVIIQDRKVCDGSLPGIAPTPLK